MERKKSIKFLVPVIMCLVVIGIVAGLVLVVANPDRSVSVAQVPASVMPLGTKAPPTATVVPVATATPEPSPTAVPSLSPTLAPTVTTVAPTATPIPLPPTPTPVPDLGIIPVRLRIPAIGVDATVEHVGKTPDGAMDVPKSVWDVAWYAPGTKPGNPGNAVIDGHLDGYNIPAAVFINLRGLQPGNKIYVSDSSGKELTFEVYDSQVYPYNAAPLDKIFGKANEPHLNLITCNGNWDVNQQNYNQRLIVFAKEVKA